MPFLQATGGMRGNGSYLKAAITRVETFLVLISWHVWWGQSEKLLILSSLVNWFLSSSPWERIGSVQVRSSSFDDPLPYQAELIHYPFTAWLKKKPLKSGFQQLTEFWWEVAVLKEKGFFSALLSDLIWCRRSECVLLHRDTYRGLPLIDCIQYCASFLGVTPGINKPQIFESNAR